MSGEPTRVLVTGANGFVGSALCARLASQDIETRAAVRSAGSARNVPPVAKCVVVGDIHADTDWATALQGVTHVVHLAARVHVMRDISNDPLAAFRAVNTSGTENLAHQAAASGVERLVYLSSIKVNGEYTIDRPFRADDNPQPKDAYAQSKLEAELVLSQIGHRSGMETVIVRPPLVYGPGVKGNFLSLLHVLQQGWPLPLASCCNRRSFVGLTNLVSLLEECMQLPAAAGQVFLAADGEDLSTPELFRVVARALGKKARLLPCSPVFLKLVASVAGRPGFYERLCGSLQVDTGKAKELLGWTPPSSVAAELARTADWFLTLRQ